MVKHRSPARKILSCQKTAYAVFFCAEICVYTRSVSYTYDLHKTPTAGAQFFDTKCQKMDCVTFGWRPKVTKGANMRQCIYKNFKVGFIL